MFKKISITFMTLASAVALLMPAAASAADRDDQFRRGFDRERAEYVQVVPQRVVRERIELHHRRAIRDHHHIEQRDWR